MYSKFTHISYDIEQQENIIRKYIFTSNMVQKEKDAADCEGNIFKMPLNKHYFDSLESVEILRNEQPRFVDQGDDDSDQMKRM